ncbi:MAG: hypothetical protein R3C04_10405 [Hyphomonas sp.]
MRHFGKALHIVTLGAAFLAGATVVGTAQSVIEAIVIGPDKIDFALPLKFSIDEGGRENINLGGGRHAIGVQNWTTYMRTNKNFAWYTGGEFTPTELGPGDGGKLAMRLTGSDLHVTGTINGMGAVPKGAILMWSGEIKDIPKGWHLANGEAVNGTRTPDLRGRFIVGEGSNGTNVYNTGNQGGSDFAKLTLDNLPSHDHGAAGSHQHRMGMVLGVGGGRGNFPLAGADVPIGAGATSDLGGEHTHAAVGGGKPFDNRPSWYALAFIIYVGA